MKNSMKKMDIFGLYRVLVIILCIILNVTFYFVMNRLNVPLYLDTVGTLFVAMLCGTFPGVLTAIATNIICEFFAPDSIYYAFIGILIALIASWFAKNEKYRSKKNFFLLILMLAFTGGVVGTLFQRMLLGDIQFPFIAETAKAIAGSNPVFYFLVSMFFIFAINVVDKGIAVTLAALAIIAIPKDIRMKIRTVGWKQAPLSLDELKSIRSRNRSGGFSLKFRIGLILVAATVLLMLVFTWVSSRLSYETSINNSKKIATSTADVAAIFIDPADIKVYGPLNKTPAELMEEDEAYKDTMNRIMTLLQSNPDISRIYVIEPMEEGYRVIYHTDYLTRDEYPLIKMYSYSGDMEDYAAELIKGGPVAPMEIRTMNETYSTAYKPLFDSANRCVAQICVDISTTRVSDYVRKLITNLVMIFAAFFVLVLAFGLKSARSYLIYPIASLENCIDGFMENIDDQNRLDENVKKLQKLDIRTNDEIEGLYDSICEMAVGTAEQMRSIRLLAAKNDKMQAGLILTMADMVENRDSDTGAHVLKTAAYVRIILEGLRRKGYYCEKITDRYIKDVEMSAPLHDLGKINVSDTILNKPGKLTEKEYEIMKTHTTAGKKILENAIGTIQGENYLKEARNMAAYHHERWDGKGYPEGLHGQVIPLSARVMAVADVFDALASPRVYKPAFPLEKALQIIREGSGTQFDPKCVEVFLDSIAEIKKVLKKYQDQDKKI